MRIAHWNTQLAATILSVGIFILVFKNQIPTASAMMIINTDIPNCIFTPVENIVLSLSMLPLPNSNVIKRLIDDERDPLSTENMVTIPPTTLLIP